MTTQQNASSPLGHFGSFILAARLFGTFGEISPFRGFIIALSRGAPATRGNESERPTVTEPPAEQHTSSSEFEDEHVSRLYTQKLTHRGQAGAVSYTHLTLPTKA